MRTPGFPEILAVIPIALLGTIYGFIFYCVWKFYQMLSKINDNIAGIRQALVRNDASQPGQPWA
jgi:hypothetical protein